MIEGFQKQFLKLCKHNFPKLTYVKKRFPNNRQKDCPDYYLSVINEGSGKDPFIFEQLLLIFLLTLNYFKDEEVYEGIKSRLPDHFNNCSRSLPGSGLGTSQHSGLQSPELWHTRPDSQSHQE